MKVPKRLEPLIEDSLIDGVVRQLMSGKEATVFVVRCGDETRCAKVTQLTGRFERSEKAVDLDSVVREIEDVRREEAARRLRLQAVE